MSPIEPKAINRASGLVVVALTAALSAPVHFDAYANDLPDATKEAVQTSRQTGDGENATSTEDDGQEEAGKESKTSIAETVRTATEASGLIGNDAQSIPLTSAIALGLAACALFAVVLKLKA